jgi:hypothetical protein
VDTASEQQSEQLGRRPLALPGLPDLERSGSGGPLRRAVGRLRANPRWRAIPLARREAIAIALMYLSARILLFLAAVVVGAIGHHNLMGELANWDGLWYRELANKGYPTHVSYAQTTLGFFPLFPLTIWPVEHLLLLLTNHALIWCATVAGVLVSGVGGLIATLLVFRLARGWWGTEAAWKAMIIFIVFPGSVVFSMVYSEGVLMPLAVGCIYLLERRRWVGACLLAGLGSAVQPVGLVLPVVCAFAVLRELHRQGWSVRRARRSLLALPLSVSGMVAFASFLWAWTGSPFANYIAQHHGWSEKTDALAVWHMVQKLSAEISFAHFNSPTINLNYVVGLIGVVLLVIMLVLVWYSRREISPEALLWAIAISFLALTSENVPPNPRMIITAFPALIVIGRYTRGRWLGLIVWVNVVLLVGLSMMTFVGHTLRP